MTNMKSCTKTG